MFLDPFEMSCAVVAVGIPVLFAFALIFLAVLNLDPLFVLNFWCRRLDVSSFLKFAYKSIHIARLYFACRYMVVPLKTVLLFAQTHAITYVQIICMFRRATPNKTILSVYRQAEVAGRILYEAQVIGTGSGLLLGSVALILALNNMFLSLRNDKFLAFAVSCWFGFYAILGLFGIIVLCCLIYEKSILALDRWKWYSLTYRFSTGYFKRYLLGLRYLSIPAGTVGKFDNIIKANYSTSLLEWTVNIMIALRHVF